MWTATYAPASDGTVGRGHPHLVTAPPVPRPPLVCQQRSCFDLIMLYVDIPTAGELKSLASHRDDLCVSIYLPTTPVTPDTDRDRIELKNLTKEAMRQLTDQSADTRRVAAISEQIDDLVDDGEFWRFQAHSLAVLATPDHIHTFRVPNALSSAVVVSDRFHL